MSYEYLIVRRDGPIEHLTLNRPDVRNAFNPAVITELSEWTSQAAQAFVSGDIRAVVLTGAGKVFCAGADAAWMAQTIGYSELENRRDAEAMARMYRAIDQLPFPVIGRVHGAALGGGAGLVAVCDIVVAETGTVFGFTEVKLGILPATISPFVLAKIGTSATRELFLTGARFSAVRAKELGLVHAVLPTAELDAGVDAFIAEILTASPQAIAAAKALLREVRSLSATYVESITAGAIAKQRVSPEGQEGLRAFLEKRRPSWAK